MRRRRRRLSWDDIDKKAARAATRRPARRRSGLIALLFVALLGSIGVVVAGFTGRGPYASLATTSTIAAMPTTTTALGGTTTIEFLLDGRDYRVGDCVIWDQDAPPGPYHRTEVVSCDEDHLIEIASTEVVEGPVDREPTLEEWDAIYERFCRGPVERRLGAPLDPVGRYYISAIKPSRAGWLQGERQVQCGFRANWAPANEADRLASDGLPRMTPYRGTATAATQFWMYEPGDCLPEGTLLPGPCGEPHAFEITGTVTLPDDTVVPAENDADAWRYLIGEGCDNRARSYLGGRPVSGWASGWWPMVPASWAAGRRTVPCFVGQRDGEAWKTVTGSARGQPA